MQVTLISVYEGIGSYGPRVLSAVLKGAGVPTRLVFLPRESEGIPWDGFRYPYAEAVLGELGDLAGGSGLIGLSLSTNYYQNAVQITARLRRSASAPIVWGGIHPTVRPEECLEHADFVCVGEGEEALLELVQRLQRGEGGRGVGNMWYRQDGKVVRTPLRPLQVDLDVYPYPDYDLETSFVLHHGHIRPLTPELLLHYSSWPHAYDSVPSYETLMARGCSYRCTFCCNDALRSIYHGEWRVRRRSIEHVLGEVEQALACLPGFQRVCFNDDEFISDREMLRRFCAAYQLRIGRPFIVMGLKPEMVDEERIGMLVDAGMKCLHMGIQTGSMAVMQRVYRRPTRREQVLAATRVLARFARRIEPPYFDLITDNPWETEQEHLETAALLLDVPRPYRLQLFSLTFFPGTQLEERARQEGLLADEANQVYDKHYMKGRERSYANILFMLFQSQRAPRWLMVFLMGDNVRRHNWIWLLLLLDGLSRGLNLLQAGWHSLWRGRWDDVARYLRYLRRRPQEYQGPQAAGRQK